MTLNQLNCQFFNVNGFVRLILLLLALKLLIRAGHLKSSRSYRGSAALEQAAGGVICAQ